MGASAWGLVRAAWVMLLLSALYEPVRLALSIRLGVQVGGVGGVGGLVNLGDPDKCDRESGRMEAYCYFPGILAGFSSFGLAVLLCWTLPGMLGAASLALSGGDDCDARTVAGGVPNAGAANGAPDGDVANAAGTAAQEAPSAPEELWLRLWSGLSCLWFCVPFCYFITDPFFTTTAAHVILCIALCAAFPLSWHLAFVAAPVSESVAPWLNMPVQSVKNFHKAIGWNTVRWAGIHGGGELIYLISTNLPKNLSLVPNGENLLNWMGITTLTLLAIHAVVAFFRRQPWLQPSFRVVHRVIAAVLLLTATAHWWPFAFFLLPTAAAHCSASAARTAKSCGRQVRPRYESLGLTAAFVGALFGLTVVWVVREPFMQRQGVDLISPFIFPPLALLVEFLCAWLAAALMLALAAPRDCSSNGVETLLAQQG